MVTKAFEQKYPGEVEQCEPTQFFLMANRPDLIGQGNVSYIVYDSRPFPACVTKPADRPWSNEASLAALLLPEGAETCQCEGGLTACEFTSLAHSLLPRSPHSVVTSCRPNFVHAWLR